MIHMMIGIQGSGKTTFAKQLAKELKIKIISTDSVRVNMPGIKEELVWPYVYKQVAIAITEGKDVIFDATSITPRVRKRFVDEVEKYGVKCEICAYYFDVEKEVCVQRVAQRNKDRSQINIPIEVVYSFSDKIIPPTFEEGFKIIKIVREGKVAEVIENE